MSLRARQMVVPAWSAVLTFAILGPLLVGPGYWLFGDMVFVPEQPWKDAWLGLDGTTPRAVPMDALVSVLTQVVPGSVVQRVLLVTAFLAGGLGAARLVRSCVAAAGIPARQAAVTLMLWNPWVYERLLIGQWAILCGYLLLPWVALAAIRFREEPRRGLPAVVVTLWLSALCSPSSGVMAVLVLVLLGATARPARIGLLAGLAVVGNAPWLAPSLVARSSTVSGEGVFAVFAATAESGAGTLASLFSLGGIWKTSIVPAERTSAVIVLLSCALTTVALLGVRRLPRPGRLVAVAGISFGVAALPALPGGAALLETLADAVPPLALLRDSHRFLAPAVLLLLPGIAAAVGWVQERVVPGRGALWAVVGLLVAAPVLLLPSLAWGSLGELDRTSYPDEWARVAERIAVEPPARTVVLPWAGSYRGLEWNDRRAVLDPAPRILPGEVVVDDRVYVKDTVVPAEDPLVEELTVALDQDDRAGALRRLGVRWVLVEHGMPSGPVPVGTRVHEGGTLTLVDLGEGVEQAPRRSEHATILGTVVLLWCVFLLVGVIVLTSSTRDGVE